MRTRPIPDPPKLLGAVVDDVMREAEREVDLALSPTGEESLMQWILNLVNKAYELRMKRTKSITLPHAVYNDLMREAEEMRRFGKWDGFQTMTLHSVVGAVEIVAGDDYEWVFDEQP